MPVDQGGITLFHLSFLKQDAQAAMHLLPARQHDEAGGVEVKTVHDQRIGVTGLHPADQAILFFFAPTGNGEQSRRFIDDQQGRVSMTIQPKMLKWLMTIIQAGMVARQTTVDTEV